MGLFSWNIEKFIPNATIVINQYSIEALKFELQKTKEKLQAVDELKTLPVFFFFFLFFDKKNFR